MPQQENRDLNLVFDVSPQPSMDGGLRRECWIRVVGRPEAIESRKGFVIARGQHAGSAF